MLGVFGLPLPDEGMLTFAGYLVYKHQLQFVPTIVSAFLGSVCGISLSYGLGHTAGFYVIEKYGHFVHITPERIQRTHEWFDRVGKWALLIGYFIPGVRHLTALLAGTAKMKWPQFALFAYSGSLSWSLTFISIGYFLGEEWKGVSEQLHRHLSMAAGVVLVFVLIYFFASQKRWQKR